MKKLTVKELKALSYEAFRDHYEEYLYILEKTEEQRKYFLKLDRVKWERLRGR